MIRLSDIAARAGVSTFTVSCALSGRGRVAAATRERIVELAAEMGYVPSAAARALAQGRRRAHGEVRDLVLAALRFGDERFYPQTLAENRRMVAVAKAAGYVLEVVDFAAHGSPRQLSRMLWARGVQGLLLLTAGAPPGFGIAALKGMEWERFSLVKITRGVDDLRCASVRPSVFLQMHEALVRVVAAGYRRIGVLLGESSSAEDDFARMGVLLAFQAQHSGHLAVDIFRHAGALDKLDKLPAEAAAWLATTQPDAVISFPPSWRYWLEAAGHRIPADFAFVGVPVLPLEDGRNAMATSGPLDDFFGQMYPTALQLLHSQIVMGWRGMTEEPQDWVLPLRWQEGGTLPPARARRRKHPS